MTLAAHTPTIPDLDAAWRLYAEIFAEVNELAAQRHLMTEAEFADVFHDPRILKFFVHDEAGDLAGMSVLTQDLSAWPLISPQYFARHWPQHYQRRAIWYVGFVGARPTYLHGFRELVSGMYPHVIASAGIAVMDFCAYNINQRRLPSITHKLLGWMNPDAGMHIADAQTFVVYDFNAAENA
ncbi:hypothetical protein ACQP2X_39720 [Actinoplanes sp. CA-131856]